MLLAKIWFQGLFWPSHVLEIFRVIWGYTKKVFGKRECETLFWITPYQEKKCQKFIHSS